MDRLLGATPFFTFMVAGQLFFLTGFTISRWFVATQEVGLYAADYRLATACAPLSLFFVTAVVPVIGSSNVGNIAANIGLFIKCCAAVGLPLAAVGAVEGGNVLGVVLGAPYAHAGPWLGILLYGLPILGVALLAGAALNHLGRTSLVALVVVLSTLLQIPIAAVATRVAGAAGVAVATLAAIIVCAATLCVLVRGLLRQCGLALIGLSIGAVTMNLILSAIMARLPPSSAAARVALEALAIVVYFYGLRCFDIDPIALARGKIGKGLGADIPAN